jgi:hypothetical protein
MKQIALSVYLAGCAGMVSALLLAGCSPLIEGLADYSNGYSAAYTACQPVPQPQYHAGTITTPEGIYNYSGYDGQIMITRPIGQGLGTTTITGY